MLSGAAQPTCFLIADISGYTSYLAGVELDHAQDILADLIATVVTALRPNFKLSKLEGDAAFTYAPTDKVDGSVLLDTIERCYFGFRRRRRDVRQATACECNACVRIPDLNLKFVVHHGQAIRQKVYGREELLGADVIVVHRLLKNDVVETLQMPAYALITQACVDRMGIDPAALDMREITETYDVIGEVKAWAHDLDRRWLEEEARQRVQVTAADAMYSVDMETKVPPQVAWEFATVPGRRVQWSTGVTDVIQYAEGNRRAVGTTNHCMHGKDAIVEEVLDWRPYDYFTVRSTMGTPAGPVKFLNTVEFEPTVDGTRLHFLFGFPKTARERAALTAMGPMFEQIFERNRIAFAALADEEQAARAAEATDEPALPEPKADGLFSEMQDLQPVG